VIDGSRFGSDAGAGAVSIPGEMRQGANAPGEVE